MIERAGDAHMVPPGSSSVDPKYGGRGRCWDAVYVDTNHHCLRAMLGNGEYGILVGVCGTLGHRDGSGTTALFHHPRSVDIDSNGNVLVSDVGNYAVRLVTADEDCNPTVRTLVADVGELGTTTPSKNHTSNIVPKHLFEAPVDARFDPSTCNIEVIDGGVSLVYTFKPMQTASQKQCVSRSSHSSTISRTSIKYKNLLLGLIPLTALITSLITTLALAQYNRITNMNGTKRTINAECNEIQSSVSANSEEDYASSIPYQYQALPWTDGVCDTANRSLGQILGPIGANSGISEKDDEAYVTASLYCPPCSDTSSQLPISCDVDVESHLTQSLLARSLDPDD